MRKSSLILGALAVGIAYAATVVNSTWLSNPKFVPFTLGPLETPATAIISNADFLVTEATTLDPGPLHYDGAGGCALAYANVVDTRVYTNRNTGSGFQQLSRKTTAYRSVVWLDKGGTVLYTNTIPVTTRDTSIVPPVDGTNNVSSAIDVVSVSKKGVTYEFTLVQRPYTNNTDVVSTVVTKQVILVDKKGNTKTWTTTEVQPPDYQYNASPIGAIAPSDPVDKNGFFAIQRPTSDPTNSVQIIRLDYNK